MADIARVIKSLLIHRLFSYEKFINFFIALLGGANYIAFC